MSKSGWTIFPFKCKGYYGKGRASKDSFTAKADRPLDLYLVI
jgi:hypothetical protein